MGMLKRCSACKEEKEFSAFCKDKNRKDGFDYRCKACVKLYQQQYHQVNKEMIAEKSRRYYADNKEAKAKRNRRYYQVNKAAIGEQAAEYKRNRRATDPTFRLIINHRRRINHALDGIGKAESSIELLGCTPAQYRHHIESKFTEGMHWNQRGLWHVDHTIPLAAFNMKFKKHQKYGFHWSNCRPMWAEDNLKKSDNHCPDELSTYLNSPLPIYADVYTL